MKKKQLIPIVSTAYSIITRKKQTICHNYCKKLNKMYIIIGKDYKIIKSTINTCCFSLLSAFDDDGINRRNKLFLFPRPVPSIERLVGYL